MRLAVARGNTKSTVNGKGESTSMLQETPADIQEVPTLVPVQEEPGTVKVSQFTEQSKSGGKSNSNSNGRVSNR